MQVKGYIYGIAHEHIDTVFLDFFHTRLVHLQQGTKGPFSLANTNCLMAITTTWDALTPLRTHGGSCDSNYHGSVAPVISGLLHTLTGEWNNINKSTGYLEYFYSISVPSFSSEFWYSTSFGFNSHWTRMFNFFKV